MENGAELLLSQSQRYCKSKKNSHFPLDCGLPRWFSMTVRDNGYVRTTAGEVDTYTNAGDDQDFGVIMGFGFFFIMALITVVLGFFNYLYKWFRLLTIHIVGVWIIGVHFIQFKFIHQHSPKRFCCLSCPSWPKSLLPQENTDPELVTRTVWYFPQATKWKYKKLCRPTKYSVSLSNNVNTVNYITLIYRKNDCYNSTRIFKNIYILLLYAIIEWQYIYDLVK